MTESELRFSFPRPPFHTLLLLSDVLQLIIPSLPFPQATPLLLTIAVIELSDIAFADLNSTLVKSRGLSSGDVVAEFKYNNKVVNVKVDTESNVSTKFTVSDVVPSAKTIVSIRLPDYSSGKFEVQYLHDHVAFTVGVGLNRSPAVDFSGTMGTPSIAFGAETSYSTSVGKFTKYNAGVCLKISGAFETKDLDKNPKFGFSLLLKP